MNRFECALLARIRARGEAPEGARVLVACSGGGDSVALLALLWALRRSLGLELAVAHADHGLREEAQQDAELVRQLCRHLDLDLVEARLDVRAHAARQGLGLESAARELRWAWLKAEAASCGAASVATGHNLDDHTETVFLRLARGGGVGALTPLPPRQGLRWSPLVELRRPELRRYLERRGLPWREDASNEEPFTPRNRWRLLLEGLRAEAPALDRALLETHRQVDELKTFRARRVAELEGGRWELELEPDPALRLAQGPWDPLELKAVLEEACRRLAWPLQADLLRDLSLWLGPQLTRRRSLARTWGGWTLRPGAQGDWLLAPDEPDGCGAGPSGATLLNCRDHRRSLEFDA